MVCKKENPARRELDTRVRQSASCRSKASFRRLIRRWRKITAPNSVRIPPRSPVTRLRPATAVTRNTSTASPPAMATYSFPNKGSPAWIIIRSSFFRFQGRPGLRFRSANSSWNRFRRISQNGVFRTAAGWYPAYCWIRWDTSRRRWRYTESPAYSPRKNRKAKSRETRPIMLFAPFYLYYTMDGPLYNGQVC